MTKTRKQLLSMALSVSLGSTFKANKQRLEAAYTRGFSQADLAEHLKKLPAYAKYNLTTLEHAVRFYLIGNKDPDIGPVYKGAIPEDLYREHSTKHRTLAAKALGTKTFLEGRGVHALSRDELRSNARAAAIAKGETPWENEEISYVLSLALSEMFKLNGKVDYSSIARHLNARFHTGKSIRSRTTTRYALLRLQRSFEQE